MCAQLTPNYNSSKRRYCAMDLWGSPMSVSWELWVGEVGVHKTQLPEPVFQSRTVWGLGIRRICHKNVHHCPSWEVLSRPFLMNFYSGTSKCRKYSGNCSHFHAGCTITSNYLSNNSIVHNSQHLVTVITSFHIWTLQDKH